MIPMNGWLAPKYLIWLLQGFGMTLGLSVSVIVAGTLCGCLLALARTSRAAPVRRAAALQLELHGAFLHALARCASGEIHVEEHSRARQRLYVLAAFL